MQNFQNNKKIVFLDRDGVINKKAADHCYITSKKDFEINDGIFEVISDFQKEGFEFIVITNQRGVARGQYSEKNLEEIHDHMRGLFKERGIELLDILYCPHNENECECRKPKSGMLKKAFQKYSIDKKSSVLISDSLSDVAMGETFGIGRNIFVHSDKPLEALNDKKKIRIAFVKYGGLISGGSEKLLQIIAVNLPKDRFEVDYFYCDPAPLTFYGPTGDVTSEHRRQFLLSGGITLIQFNVKEIDVFTPTHIWRGTNFFDVFDEDAYDMIQTCRSGHKQFPFTNIRRKPIIDIIALSSGSDNQYNIAKVLHLCKWSADRWISRGGDRKRVRYVSLPIDVEADAGKDMCSSLSLDGKFVFGMHQRVSDEIFSEIPLLAYSKIENNSTAFVILGGSDLYKIQAKKLGLQSVIFLDQTGDSTKLFLFLRTLSVYAHGRKDGEVNSQAIAEALYVGLPIVSHTSEINNGHIECIGNAGNVVSDVDEYAEEMNKLFIDKVYFKEKQKLALLRFKEHYEMKGQIQKYVDIYEDVYKNPFPNKKERLLSSLHYTQNLRVLIVWLYLQIKYWYFLFRKK